MKATRAVGENAGHRSAFGRKVNILLSFFSAIFIHFRPQQAQRGKRIMCRGADRPAQCDRLELNRAPAGDFRRAFSFFDRTTAYFSILVDFSGIIAYTIDGRRYASIYPPRQSSARSGGGLPHFLFFRKPVEFYGLFPALRQFDGISTSGV